MSIAHEQAKGRGKFVDRSFQNTLTRMAKFCAIVAVLTPFVGCLAARNTFDEPLHGYRNHVWANRAFNLRYGNRDVDFEDHFKQGFVDGYCDVCNGGDGYVPAVPPKDYWSYQYQSPEGAKCVNTWFKAYPLGVKAAREDGSGSFQKVYISKMIQSAIVQEKANHVLPDDVPVVSNESNGTTEIQVPASLPGGPVPINGPVSYPATSPRPINDPMFSK